MSETLSDQLAIPFLFVPGNEQRLVGPKGDHRDLLDVIAHVPLHGNARYQPLFVQPDWENGTPSTWVSQVVAEAEGAAFAAGTDEIALGGFSFGALMTLLAAARLEQRQSTPRPLGVMAASLAPYVSEMLPVLVDIDPDEINNLSPAVMRELRTMRFPKVNCPVQLYVGEHERPYMQIAAGFALSALSDASLVMVRGTFKHNILDERYMIRVREHVGALASKAVLQH